MSTILFHVVNLLLYHYNPCLDISTIELDIPNVDSIGSDYLIISIFGYYFGDLWGLKGIYTILVVLYVMSTAQSSCIMWSVQWYIYVCLFWMSYPHLRFVGEGPFQRAGLWLCGVTLCWCHYCVRGPFTYVYFSTSTWTISWRSMAAPSGFWPTGLSGWIPALGLIILIYIS